MGGNIIPFERRKIVDKENGLVLCPRFIQGGGNGENASYGGKLHTGLGKGN